MSVSGQSTSPTLERLLSGATEVGPTAAEVSQGEGGQPARKESGRSPPSGSDLMFLQPWNPRLVQQTFSNTHNFQPKSNTKVLKVTKERTFWWPDVTDAGINDLLVPDAATRLSCSHHTLIVFFIYLEYNHEAQYKRQASISQESLKRLVGRNEMHDSD